jgi:hypothetical protein
MIPFTPVHSAVLMMAPKLRASDIDLVQGIMAFFHSQLLYQLRFLNQKEIGEMLATAP